MGLTADDLKELIPSGKRSRHQDRTYWAITYLFQAALLERPGRGSVRISPRGAELLKTGARPITLTTLAQFPEFADFKGRRKDPAPSSNDVPTITATDQALGNLGRRSPTLSRASTTP